ATTLLQDNVVRYSVGLFVFAFLFVVAAAGRMDTRVDQLAVLVSACLGIACIGTLLYLIDYAAKLLRPITILARVSRQGLAVIESVYPETSIGRAGAGGGLQSSKAFPRRRAAARRSRRVNAKRSARRRARFIIRVLRRW